MAPRRIRPDQLADVLPRGGLAWLQACSAESALLRDGLVAAGDRLGPMAFTGIFVPGLNRLDYIVEEGRRAKTFFMTPELRRGGAATEFLPFCYREILQHLYGVPIGAALFMASPPNADGLCSVGPVADFVPDFWRRIPVRVAHINPAVPWTQGYEPIPFSELTAYVEGEQPLLTSAAGAPDAATDAIGRFVAALAPEGATIQTGLGRVPEAVTRALRGHRNIRIHSGLIGDAAVDLLESGALAPGPAIVAGVAIGSQRLYEAIASDRFQFRPAIHTHSQAILAGIERFVAINSAAEIDLLGNAFAEHTSGGLVSGPGGASDFCAGAAANGGLRVIAMPSTVGKAQTSRIIAPGAALGPVSLNRFDIDFVVTEHGVADLRLKTYEARARALIDVAAPQHRATLDAAWGAWANRFHHIRTS